MKPTYYVIYVPGLADKLNRNAVLQGGAVRLWRLSRRVGTHYFAANWADQKEHLTHKVQRLLKVIDAAHTKGYHVALVAASAGSGLVMAAYAKRKDSVSAVVSICGKLRHPETVPKPLFIANPCFKDAIMSFAHTELGLTEADRQKILVVQAGRDGFVPDRDGHITGANYYRMASAGHVLSIMLALTVYRHRLIRFIKTRN